MSKAPGNVLLLLGAMAALGACNSKPAPAGATSAAAGSSAPPNAFKPPAAKDPELMQLLTGMAESCQPVPGEDRVNCGGKQWQLISEFVGKKRARNSAAIATLTTALSDPDIKLRGLSASVLRSAFGAGWASESAPQAIRPEDALALLRAVAAQPIAVARQAVPAAVHAAMLAGQAPALHTQLVEQAGLQEAAYPHLMTFGRGAELATVQRVVKDSDLPLALAALDAPLNMSALTPDEETQICPWVDGLLTDSRPPIAQKAALVMARCSGSWLDKLLKQSEKRLAASDVDAKDVAPLAKMCPSDAPPSRRATEKQCQRMRELVLRVARSPTAGSAARKAAEQLVNPAAPAAEAAMTSAAATP